MRTRALLKQLDDLLDEILAEDARTRARSRRIIPREVADAMEYFVRWKRARNRAEALIQLALPLAVGVTEKVREVDLKAVGANVTRARDATKPRGPG